MNWSERRRVALRYTFAYGQGHLSSFLSSLSMLGLVLAIALLIVVLSVMNGFDREMRERILALVPHVTLYSHQPMEDWRERVDAVNAEVDKHARVGAVIVGTEPWTIDNGVLTPTLKIRRERVEEQFGERARELARQAAEKGEILVEWVYRLLLSFLTLPSNWIGSDDELRATLRALLVPVLLK